MSGGRLAERPEVALGPGSLAVGDLHLDVSDAAAVARFVDFLQRLSAAGAKPEDERRLILLGDVFEYWVGPSQCGLDGAPLVLAALAGLVGSGWSVDLIPGNRDFLLDARFEQLSGVQLRPDGMLGCIARRPGPTGGDAGADPQRVLFLHGDELCTLDRPYQRLRRVLRSAPVRVLSPRIPGPVATRLAARLRRASRSAIERKPTPSMAQQPSAAIELAERHGADVLVCGHAHRWRDEALAGLRWLVVDAFGGRSDAVLVDSNGELIAACAKTLHAPN